MKKGLRWGVGIFALLLGVAVSRPLYARTLGEVMTSVEKGVTTLKDIKGTQTIKFVLGNDTIIAENIFITKAPDKFRASTVIPIPGQKKAQKQKVLTVCDGKYIWQYVLPPEEQKVIKMDLASAPGMAAQYQKKFMQTGYGVVGVDNLLKLAGADYDLKVVGTSKLAGQEMDVLEGALLKKNPAETSDVKTVAGWNLPVPARIKYLIGVKNGFIYQTQGFDNEGKVMLEIGYRNLKFNTGVSDKVFVFKLPKGVPVVEATEVVPSLVK